MEERERTIRERVSRLVCRLGSVSSIDLLLGRIDRVAVDDDNNNNNDGDSINEDDCARSM